MFMSQFSKGDYALQVGVAEATNKETLQEKVPFAVLSVSSAVVTWLAQKQGGAMVHRGPFLTDAAGALVGYVSYLLKTVWPARLAVFYPYVAEPLWLGALALAAIVAISILAVRYAKTYPWLAFGWFWYLITLLPVIGFIRVGGQALADRYTYIPLVGLFIILVWGGGEMAGRWRNGLPAASERDSPQRERAVSRFPSGDTRSSRTCPRGSPCALFSRGARVRGRPLRRDPGRTRRR